MEKSRLKNIFKEKYIIPCFQREYSWDDENIKELIDDIKDLKNEYCLGVLVIKNKKNEKVLIDGQQRLTTLYMIAIRCGYITKKDEINLESELTNIIPENINGLHLLLDGNEESVQNNLLKGWKSVKKNIKKIEDNIENINKSFEEFLYFYEINLDESININHYFEVMNSRGVQLSRSDIIKSYLMKKFDGESDNQSRLNYMWYIYEKMDENSNCIKNFNEITIKYKNEYKTINEILDHSTKNKKNEDVDIVEDKSILNFEYFLLYVIRLYNQKNDLPCDYEGEFNLKDMISEYEHTFKNSTSKDIISFLNFMIEIKTIYNQYILKNKGDSDNWKINKTTNKKLVMLQACMRVSFINRNVMHWLYMSLGYFYKSKDLNNYIKYMEGYIINKYIEEYKKEAEKLENPYETGFDTPIIVLNYLDYWMKFNNAKVKSMIPEAKKIDYENFTFKFRNSIEHFMPRHNAEGEYVHSIGNLALLMYGTNTRMQDAYPEVKAKHFNEEKLENYSIKLQIMSLITLERGWGENEIKYLTEKTKEMIEEIIKEK